MDEVYLVSEKDLVKRIEIISAPVFFFLKEQRDFFPEDGSFLDEPVRKLIQDKGACPERLKVILFLNLISICGQKKRKDIYDFLINLSRHYPFRFLAC